MLELARFLLKRLKPFRRTILFCVVLAVLAALLDMFGPILMGRSFDLAKSGTVWLWYVGAILAWFAAGLAADRLRSYLMYKGDIVSQEASARYGREAMTELLDKPLAFHYGRKSQETAEKISMLSNDMQWTISGIAFDLTPAVLTVLAIVIYLCFVDLKIAAVTAVTVALLMYYTIRTAPKSISNRDAWGEAEREINSFGWDSIRNILVVKSTVNERAVAAGLDERGRKLTAALMANTAFDRRVLNIQNLIVRLGSVAILMLGLADFAAGRMTFGALTAVAAYTFTIFGYVKWSQWQFRVLIKAASSLKRLKELMAEPREDYARGRPLEIRGDVEYRGVRFRYREDKPALEDISFSVRRGQRVAIVGESGEGKTTLVDLLGRYYLPQAGSILIDGVDVADIRLKSLRSQMAYVPQDLTLFHESIDFNIRYGRPEATDGDVREAARLARLDEFIESLPEKYATMVGERGLKLSGGERQRVALARAFLRDPRILVLDEPTSNLDSKTEEIIRHSLDKLMEGRTTFIIAHRLRTIMDADRILVLKDGRIVEQGRHEELVCDPGSVYSQLLKAQGGFISPGEQHLGEAA